MSYAAEPIAAEPNAEQQGDVSPVKDDFRRRMEMTTEAQLRLAFSTLAPKFTIQNLLPPKMETPFAFLKGDARQQCDGLNLALEKNVSILFAMESLQAIRDALIAVVSHKNNPVFPHDTQKEKEMKEAIKGCREGMLQFYPNLVGLIQALQAYHAQHMGDTTAIHDPLENNMFHAWMKVLGYLMSIHNVIAYCVSSKLLKLDKWPIDIDKISTISKAATSIIHNQIQVYEKHIAEQKQILQTQEEKINAIKEQNMGADQRIAGLESTLMNLRHNYGDLTDPRRIAEKNVEQLRPLTLE